MTVSLIIPAYNEAARLPGFLKRLATFSGSRPGLITEVLVVDDGSTDDTSARAEAFRERLPGFRLLRHPINRGKGAAIQLGVSVARADAIIFMDADGATPPEEIPLLVTTLASSPIAVGNRWSRASTVHGQTSARALTSRVLRLLMALFGFSGIDTMCGCKGFQRPIALRLFHPLLETRWLFDQEVLFRARLLHIPIISVPIHWTSQHGSKVTPGIIAGSALMLPLLLARVWWQTRHDIRPALPSQGRSP